MIHGGVEDALLLLVHGLDVDGAETLIPLGLSFSIYTVEIPVGKLSGEVSLSILVAHGRDTHLGEHLLVLCRIESERSSILVVHDMAAGLARNRLRELCHEVYDMLCPTLRASEASDVCRVYNLKVPLCGALSTNTRAEVYKDGRLVASEGILMQTSAVSGSEAYLHTIVGELHGVEARLHSLQIMVEKCIQMLTISSTSMTIACIDLHLCGVKGHEQHVA